jgi:26S proteasome regulatory subunit N5
MVQLALQDDNYLEACSAYQEVWDTAEVKADEAREVNVSLRVLLVVGRSPTRLVMADPQVIENIITYVILAHYNNEQSDMLHKLHADTSLQKAPIYQ